MMGGKMEMKARLVANGRQYDDYRVGLVDTSECLSLRSFHF